MADNGTTWLETNIPSLLDKLIVTVSMEGYIPELHGDAREANTKGGLGIYFGDKLEGLAQIGIHNAFGCMPLYQKRLVQDIQNGRQVISYKDVSYAEQPIIPLVDANQRPVRLDVWGFDTQQPNREVPYQIQVYTINRGGTRLYLFHCPEVFDVLYPDKATHNSSGRRHRFLQETVFAQCVTKLFKYLAMIPDALLINEGHVAVAAAMTRGDPMFDKTAIIYTNHTVVSAGLEVFDIGDLVDNDVGRARYIMRFPPNSWQWLWQKFIVECDGKILIDFSKGALEICSAANAVSAEHARVTRSLFSGNKKRIAPVLNGSGNTWVADKLLAMERRNVTPTPGQLMKLSQAGKSEAFKLVQQRTMDMTNAKGELICPEGVRLDLDKPTLWLARRMVAYKSQYPILKDIIHVLCADRDEIVETRWGPMPGLAMQVVVAGVAPQHTHEEHWIQTFVGWMQRPELKGRFVFVPGCDTELLKWQARGADICLNCPQPNKEACGTSDQRTARNGGINIAVYSGGPPEYLEDNQSGMLVGPYIHTQEFHELAPKDILDKLGILSEQYYARHKGDKRWQNMKLRSYLASQKVTAQAMEERYAYIYDQAMHNQQATLRHGHEEKPCQVLPLEQTSETAYSEQSAQNKIA